MKNNHKTAGEILRSGRLITTGLQRRCLPPGQRGSRSNGFTLVEITIVVVIIGLLAAMAVPAFRKVREESQAKRIANDFRIFSGAFNTAAMQLGAWPEDGVGNSLPESVQPYVGTAWTDAPVDGGFWDWEGVGRHGVTASVSLVDAENNLSSGITQKVDEMLDDGELSTGSFQNADGNRYIYILEL